jgi:hypothetical protein
MIRILLPGAQGKTTHSSPPHCNRHYPRNAQPPPQSAFIRVHRRLAVSGPFPIFQNNFPFPLNHLPISKPASPNPQWYSSNQEHHADPQTTPLRKTAHSQPRQRRQIHRTPHPRRQVPLLPKRRKTRLHRLILRRSPPRPKFLELKKRSIGRSMS